MNPVPTTPAFRTATSLLTFSRLHLDDELDVQPVSLPRVAALGQLERAILLVEDDTATAVSIELMLKAEGFDVETTDLGEEAIELATSRDYDIILLSLGLPDMSGFQVLLSLRTSRVSTPILILTGFPLAEPRIWRKGWTSLEPIRIPHVSRASNPVVITALNDLNNRGDIVGNVYGLAKKDFGALRRVDPVLWTCQFR